MDGICANHKWALPSRLTSQACIYFEDGGPALKAIINYRQASRNDLIELLRLQRWNLRLTWKSVDLHTGLVSDYTRQRIGNAVLRYGDKKAPRGLGYARKAAASEKLCDARKVYIVYTHAKLPLSLFRTLFVSCL
jgi:hypothetical protein